MYSALPTVFVPTPIDRPARFRRGLLAAVLVLLALLAAACAGTGTAEGDGQPVRFSVAPGTGMRAVADTLSERGLIRWPQAFVLYGRYRGAAGSLKPGVYEVERGTSWAALLDRIVAGDVVRMTITVPEGWTAAQIGARIAAAAGAEPDSVIALLLAEESAERFEVPGPTLEGYLYPATYVLPRARRSTRIVETMARRYRAVWTDELRARADSARDDEREVVTLASIVEKEARVWTERDTIAGVYLNRLRDRHAAAGRSDGAVRARLAPARLLYAHIDEVADHPYNTYRPRAAARDPSLAEHGLAIRAALYPADVTSSSSSRARRHARLHPHLRRAQSRQASGSGGRPPRRAAAAVDPDRADRRRAARRAAAVDRRDGRFAGGRPWRGAHGGGGTRCGRARDPAAREVARRPRPAGARACAPRADHGGGSAALRQ
jgi:UPF0755 protein